MIRFITGSGHVILSSTDDGGVLDNEVMAARESASRGVSEAVEHGPAAELRPYIARYNGYRQAGVAPATHTGLPSPFLTLIVTLDEPLTVAAHPDPRQPSGEYVTLAGGLHTAPALIRHEGSQSGVQVALSPLGARAVLGMPAGQLASLDVEGADVIGPLAAELHQRVHAAETWPDRFAVLDEVLSRRVRAYLETGRPDAGGEVAAAWRRLLATGGTIGVGALAAETGWSERHLRTRFAAEIGLTPKAAARVIRFDRARRVLQRRAARGRPLGLASVAAEFGYYDQAHLDAEFRAIAGRAPTAWLAQEFRNLQATVLAAEAG